MIARAGGGPRISSRTRPPTQPRVTYAELDAPTEVATRAREEIIRVLAEIARRLPDRGEPRGS
jgi:hypothetical protein